MLNSKYSPNHNTLYILQKVLLFPYFQSFQPLLKSGWRIFKKIKINLLYDLDKPLLDICPKDSISLLHRYFYRKPLLLRTTLQRDRQHKERVMKKLRFVTKIRSRSTLPPLDRCTPQREKIINHRKCHIFKNR